MLEIELQSEADTLALARSLAAVLEGGDVIGLEGGLGAGKTTFIRGAVHGLGVTEETAVTSPTFALVHQYEGRLRVAHADFYRLAGEAELEELGVDELIEEGAVLFVEWGRKFPWMSSRTVLWVELEIVSEVGRRARLRPQGARGDAIIGALGR
ncbi:MAG: tRNA (adenosine(37)-N6)-threonylcarbamoyltransferase complex ATPase subunit type 1 TsaE [Deltaproteobacteria bacterium]|jgi:tRNA threonylcarbamoyladenosine biosynthesis protein TsaE|nr:tRNA (adenosine(37)-N6)-threonylcarbamoyltransferase complex ATPase subunit type 1 TsaE [Deltaproteobacteria bacterium]MBW1874241.1 tRNA (adenosine(37)-N6)-threonylcarbamoyltransferase complex ATPase subunit type 1 TsaE [Deltaproteobacteria bacterium]MBW2210249.1 tRNA (adenosine(37)-N6)-threonylcarbamoyltransferase complex ATPase subunit type 1 TsaE [Deltaproteobacteria bacterium]MBW2212893.1 tRNA (adenosine(37)-N6)-threonylcarbamoyltransferase complex ATPase subunit type 1 TsaE [Deltaproteob